MSEAFEIQGLTRSIHEVLVLDVLRDEPRHGYQIALEVEERSAGRFALQHGTLYPILHRLEEQGAIAGEWSSEDGRRRKVYRITRDGRSRADREGARIGEVLEAFLRTTGGGGAPLRRRA